MKRILLASVAMLLASASFAEVDFRLANPNYAPVSSLTQGVQDGYYMGLASQQVQGGQAPVTYEQPLTPEERSERAKMDVCIQLLNDPEFRRILEQENQTGKFMRDCFRR